MVVAVDDPLPAAVVAGLVQLGFSEVLGQREHLAELGLGLAAGPFVGQHQRGRHAHGREKHVGIRVTRREQFTAELDGQFVVAVDDGLLLGLGEAGVHRDGRQSEGPGQGGGEQLRGAEGHGWPLD